jgi:hypothetical protein
MMHKHRDGLEYPIRKRLIGKLCPHNLWENIGGGCFLDGFKSDYPCDDQYENSNTMRRVTVYSTEERHFDMPEFVDDPSELYLLDGVKPEWEEDSDAWKHG